MTLTSSKRFYTLIVLTCFLAGCVSWAAHGVDYSSSRQLRIAVLPVRNEVQIEKLQNIESVTDSEKKQADQTLLIRQQMQAVTEDMTRAIEGRLSEYPAIEVVSHEQVEAMLVSLGLPTAKPLTAGQIERLGIALDVQAVLEVRLSGYGRLKREWITILLGTGVGEGVAQGVVVARATANVALGVAAMLEEVGQEVLTWGGGSYFFNEHYSPVILEGRLVSVTDGKTLWSDTAFSSIDKKALAKLPEDEQKKRQVQLEVTAEKTERDLTDKLGKAVDKHLQK
jgi:hypothetical protein